MSIRIRYDPEVDALMIYLRNIAPGEAVKQIWVPDIPSDSEVVLDYDGNGVLLGIEIIGASKSVPPSLLESSE